MAITVKDNLVKKQEEKAPTHTVGRDFEGKGYLIKIKKKEKKGSKK